MGQVIWTDKAAGHLQSIHEYISKDSLNYADSFIHSLIQATQKLEQFPLIGRKVPEFENSGYNFKEVIYRGYRIIYHIKDSKNDVEILAVMNGRRDVGAEIKNEWDL